MNNGELAGGVMSALLAALLLGKRAITTEKRIKLTNG